MNWRIVFILPCLLFADNYRCNVKPTNWVPAPCEERTWIMIFSSGLGVQHSRQKFDENLELSYLKNFNTIQWTGTWTVAWERLLLKCNFDYGWLVNGDVATKGFQTPFQRPVESFGSFPMGSGYSVDIQPSIGARVRFWPLSCGSISFIPSLGYNYSHFNVFPRSTNTASPPGGAGGLTNLTYSRPLQQDWFGPFAEGRIAFSWLEQWRLDWIYQYTHVTFRQTYSQAVTNFITTAGALTLADTAHIRVSSNGNSLRTQLGGVEVSYRSLCNHWQLGTLFTGSSTWSQTAKSIVRVANNSFLPTHTVNKRSYEEQLSVNWTRYIINLYGSYWF